MLDVEKAFNQIEWEYSESFIDWVKLLYSATVSINWTMSSPFSISKGTKQGCPSSLLFVLVTGPLAEAIRSSVEVTNIQTRFKKDFSVC